MNNFTQNDLDRYKELSEFIGKYEERLLNRVTEIIHFLCDFYQCSYDTWYFANAGEGECGSPIIYELNPNQDISYVLEAKNIHKMPFSDSFPYEFLFMSNREIEEYIGNMK